MRQPPVNVCPLLVIAKSNPAVCLEDRCAWWDYASNGCAAASIASGLTDVTAELKEKEAYGR